MGQVELAQELDDFVSWVGCGCGHFPKPSHAPVPPWSEWRSLARWALSVARAAKIAARSPSPKRL